MKEINEVNTGTGGRGKHTWQTRALFLHKFLGLSWYNCVFSAAPLVCVCVLAEDKVMTLRVKHKDRELLFTPSRETRKEGTEWLKALKKVSPMTVVNRRALLCACNAQGGVGMPDN